MSADSKLDRKGIVDLSLGPAGLVEASQIETVVAAAIRDHEDDIQRPGSSPAGRDKEQSEANGKEDQDDREGFFLHVYHSDWRNEELSYHRWQDRVNTRLTYHFPIMG